MKKILFIVPCFLLLTAGQNVSAATPDDGRQLVSCISNTEMNVMYRDYDNKFRVMVQGVADEKVKVQSEDALVRKENGLWIVTPNTDNWNITIHVFADIKGKTREAGSYTYRVKPLPRPTSYLVSDGKAVYSEEDVTKQMLLDENAVLELTYGADGILDDMPFKICGFDIIYKDRGVHSNSNRLTNGQQKMISQMKTGDKVVINSIRAIGPKEKQYALTPMVFIIK